MAGPGPAVAPDVLGRARSALLLTVAGVLRPLFCLPTTSALARVADWAPRSVCSRGWVTCCRRKSPAAWPASSTSSLTPYGPGSEFALQVTGTGRSTRVPGHGTLPRTRAPRPTMREHEGNEGGMALFRAPDVPLILGKGTGAVAFWTPPTPSRPTPSRSPAPPLRTSKRSSPHGPSAAVCALSLGACDPHRAADHGPRPGRRPRARPKNYCRFRGAPGPFSLSARQRARASP